MERLRVIDLKAIARTKGLRGYSKLRKAELINFLRQNVEVIFVEEPEVSKNQSRFRSEKRKRKAEKNRKKRESKKRNKKRGVQKEGNVDIDQLVKEVEEELKRKDKKKKQSFVKKQNVFTLVKTNSAFNGFANHYKIEEEGEDEEEKKGRRNILEKEIKRLKKKKRKSKDGKRKRSLQKAIDDKVKVRHYPFKKVYVPESFLLAVKPTIENFLRENPNTKIILNLKCRMSKTDLKTGNVIFTSAYFSSNVEINFQGIDVSNLYKVMSDKMLESLATYQQRGSNWVFDSIEELVLHTVKYEPLSGSSFIPLPKALADKKAIINMENDDNQCFKWCIARALNPVERNPKRITKILQLQAEKLNWKAFKFPMELSQINRFEKLNEISVNVFGYEKNEVYPLRVSKSQSYATRYARVNLLLISEGNKNHYCLIKSMSRLLSNQTSTKKQKKFYCLRCLNSFGRQDLLDKHLEVCQDSEAVKIKMPEEGECVYFKNHFKKMDLPFVIYADFESLMRQIHTVQQNREESYTDKKMLHIPVSFCYYVKCFFDDSKSKVVKFTATAEDEDVAQKFVNKLEEDVKSIYKDYPKKKMIFTKTDNDNYKKSESCWICGEGFTSEEHLEGCKVRDHCHYTGKFRGAAHNSCNIKYRRPKFTPVIFHNLSGYDAHLFIKNLGKSKGNIDCIPNNEEKYISFTKHVEVDRFMKDEKEVIVTRELRFIDSYKFIGSSLDEHVDNLSEDDFVNTNKYFNGEHLNLLKRKGVYPYEWLDSVERLNETQLPSKDAFYSKLNGQGISNEDYVHAQKVWKAFNMKSMRDYHNLYNLTDVLLLADVFEKFRKLCKKNYDLDPCWYYTVPGLAWDACLKITKINLELLTDPDMLLMFEKGVRGGVSMICTRHSKANNKYMGKKFDASKLFMYIMYLDDNNLYGYAMCKKLPTGGFKWMTEEELKEWRSYPCVLEVDLEYSKELHDLHNEYPLAPERLMTNGVEKLIPNLNDKKHYVLHYESLKQYESLGLKITHIHRGIKFEESDWMKQYIDLNTNLRAKAKNDFEKDFFKLMNNSVYGKTIENLRKRVNISLVNSEKKAKRLTAKPNFKKCTIFSKNLCAIEMRKTQIYFNKPVYLGMCILDLSKTLMYDFHYNYIKPKYKERAKLLFTDTDSLAYEIQTEDFYRDISPDVQATFDTSNFSENHPSGILTGANKKVIGMFKDEAGGKIIEEFVSLRAKLYSYKMFESKTQERKRKMREKLYKNKMIKNKTEKKKCKGMKQGVVENTITFDDYKTCLFSGKPLYRQMMTFRSRKHEVFTEEMNKVALSANDDKRIILPDKVNTLAYGHYSLVT